MPCTPYAYISAAFCVIAAVASFLRGSRTPFPQDELATSAIASNGNISSESASTTVQEPSR